MSDLIIHPNPPGVGQHTELVAARRPPAGRFEDEIAIIWHYARLLLRRKWLVLAVAATILALNTIQVFTTTPHFTAIATLQIDPEEPNILPYEAIATLPTLRASQEYLATQARNLQTRNMARRVAKRLDLAEDPVFNAAVSSGFLTDQFYTLLSAIRRPFSRSQAPPAARAEGKPTPSAPRRLPLGKFLGGLKVEQLRNTRLLRVSYTLHDSRLAATVLNTTLDEFIEMNLEGRYEATTKATDFLRRQLTDLKITVEKSEETLITYARDNDIVNLSERETINLQKLVDLSDEVTRVEAELIGLTAQYEAIKDADVDRFPEILKNDAIRHLDSRLSELGRRRAALSEQYGPEWPAVKQVDGEITEVRRQLIAGKQRAIATAKASYEVAVARHRRLTGALSAQRRTVDRLNDDTIQYNILKREVETNKELYEGLLQRLKEAGVAAGLRSSNIRVVDKAVTPHAATSPQKLRSTIRALMVGFVLGIAVAFLVEMLDNTLKSADDVTQYLGLPSLGLIPVLEGFNGRGNRQKALTVTQGQTRRPLLAHGEASHARVWEAYRSLRTSILLSHSGKPPQTILVASALPGEGKTTTVANTATVLAQTGARTLMLDLDMRKPTLAALFGVARQQGMSTFLSGNSDLSSQIRETRFPNLYIVASGPPAPNPAELIGSQRMNTGLQLLEEFFTYIVIDSPPFLEITDALVVSRRADGVLLVAHGGKTPRDAVKKARDRLHYVGAKILGVLLNNVDHRKSHDAYYYYYGHQGGYYGSYFSTGAHRPERKA
ncbi:MAG: polysaccharide biosynthesis tyrosine autokinase [bacterium]|nr:polysaccharide biosynthesis tyrosine autokinase [bacterium]